jgi:hypothetical protein
MGNSSSLEALQAAIDQFERSGRRLNIFVSAPLGINAAVYVQRLQPLLCNARIYSEVIDVAPEHAPAAARHRAMALGRNNADAPTLHRMASARRSGSYTAAAGAAAWDGGAGGASPPASSCEETPYWHHQQLIFAQYFRFLTKPDDKRMRIRLAVGNCIDEAYAYALASRRCDLISDNELLSLQTLAMMALAGQDRTTPEDCTIYVYLKPDTDVYRAQVLSAMADDQDAYRYYDEALRALNAHYEDPMMARSRYTLVVPIADLLTTNDTRVNLLGLAIMRRVNGLVQRKHWGLPRAMRERVLAEPDEAQLRLTCLGLPQTLDIAPSLAQAAYVQPAALNMTRHSAAINSARLTQMRQTSARTLQRAATPAAAMPLRVDDARVI